ncbi:carbohydrate esterase family 4 protein [Mycena amicta]|nr:carbohydrate esterase family 4 protein [Mycena amicta]
MLPVVAFLALFASAGASLSAVTLKARQGAANVPVITSCVVSGDIALTFDDGPYDWLEYLCDTASAAGAKITFMNNGLNWRCIYDKHAEMQKCFGQGHQFCSHTWAHKDLTTLNATELTSEIDRTNQALVDILGVKPKWIRPPYGSYNDDVVNAAAQRGQQLVTWDMDSGDSTGSPPEDSEAMYDNIANKTQNATICLNHETSNSTVHEVFPHALEVLIKAGFRLVTLAECLGEKPYVDNPGPKQPASGWHC